MLPISQFYNDGLAYESDLKANIGNLTCALANLRLLDANLNINIKHYRTEMWSMVLVMVTAE
jgi:hypothetical protein